MATGKKSATGRTSFRKAVLSDKRLVGIKLGRRKRIDWCLPTGLAIVDIYSGRDVNQLYGIPCSSIVTVSGNPSAGKTTFSLGLMASAQRPDILKRRPPLECIHQEIEGILTAEDMERAGVCVADVIQHEPDSLEEAFDGAIYLLEESIKKQVPLMLVLDSLSAMPVIGEIDGKKTIMQAGQPGSHSRVTSKAFRVITRLLRRSRSIYVIIVQSKEDIGGSSFFKSKTFMAEKPLMFHSGLVYDVARTGWVKPPKKKDIPANATGMLLRILVKKNKGGPPMRSAERLILDFEKGFDTLAALHEALEAKKLVKRVKMSYVLQKKVVGRKDPIKYKGRTGINNLPKNEQVLLKKVLQVCK